MFDALTRLFGRSETGQAEPVAPRLAVAALLVHLASVDGAMRAVEAAVIATNLKDHYGLDDAQVRKLIQDAKRKDSEAVDFYQFTSALTRLEPAERLAIIRMMWQVVYADGQNHELEDNMVWRVAELIGVSARERTVIRSQVRADAHVAAPEDESED